MKKLFDSVAFEEDVRTGIHRHETIGIAYEFLDSDSASPYIRITFKMALTDGGMTDIELDIPRDDMVDLLNEVVDEWPEIVDCQPVHETTFIGTGIS